MSITVMYHGMSDCTVSVSTKKSDMYITVMYHTMSLTVLYQYQLRRVIIDISLFLVDTDTVQSETYHSS
jgi:hypothetical protein